ncbi:transcriptional regulator, XRE family with cupin sensor [Alkalithermobacter thermoalcaliphilus JW-YL-7 = DSM 7308]|uniref:Transcriptional regulator, XRE family with cupin 2 sensor n=1 Tax=Alkalithermobacter thermoalcaliphilus JW-YL-7 = DSM 7308 TaxID=1121328 RepID=A0A150FRS6_CLOPD|nr:transcriptional regulator, XRE family with cupin 2 sensor [[Clostridium] paradoxum JW-YL-7 = DSM 7308]SHK77544.1 transcriptional regulator, XRE family with cupin sensor [[Clostridium] paradoxum JW-YL-7 = DSM 7308]
MKIGEKIKQLRILNELTQEELAQRCDLTKGFISKIERDITSPSIATLMDILEALGTDLKSFFNESVEEKVVYTKDDIYESSNEDLKHTIHWLIPNSQKHIMESILIDIEPSGSTSIDRPHNGEEFGYVIKGTITLHIGGKKFKVKKGESFYFTPHKEHYIVNNSNKIATVLWVSSPPSF